MARVTPLRRLREQKGLRPIHLAAAANISTQQLHNLEMGKNSPTLVTAQALAAALEVDVDVLWPPVATGMVARGSAA